MPARRGDVVTMAFTAKLEDGTVVDTSQGHPPLELALGKGRFIKGLEKAIVGMNVGDVRHITLPAPEAYGERDEGLVQTFAIDELDADLDADPGLFLTLSDEDGNELEAYVLDVSDEAVTLDFNHHLAGKQITFEIKLLGINRD